MEKTITFFRGNKLETAIMVIRANTGGEVARAVRTILCRKSIGEISGTARSARPNKHRRTRFHMLPTFHMASPYIAHRASAGAHRAAQPLHHGDAADRATTPMCREFRRADASTRRPSARQSSVQFVSFSYRLVVSSKENICFV